MREVTVNGKVYRIPQADIDNYIATLGVSEKDAIDLWLCDHDIEENEEQIALDEKAKTVKIDHGAESDKTAKKKSDKPKTVKVSDEKAQIFAEIVEKLSENYEIVVVTNNKMLEINLNGKNFKLNLSETRPKK